MANRISKKPVVSRQYELSQAHIEANSVDSEITRTYVPGGLPDMPNEGLKPDDYGNRALEISQNGDTDDAANLYLGLQDIDEAIFYYFENVIKPSVLLNGDLVDVPVIYGSGERWKMAQKDGFYRDKGGKIQTPLVMLKRESISKRRDLGNKLDANNPQLYVSYQEKYTSKNKYDNFALLNNRIPQKEFTATVVPDYVNLVYQGIIWTDYISQLNKIIEAVNYASDAYWGDEERFKFMAQIDQFSNINEISNDDSRIVRASFTLNLQGYIIPENIQKKLKDKVKWYSKSQFVLNNQTTVIEDRELSNRARQFSGTPLSSTTVVSTGGDTGTGSGLDDDWTINDTFLVNSENRDVQINNAYLSVDIGDTKSNDILLIKKEGDAKLRVNNDGILQLKVFDSLPGTAIDGGIIFNNGDFYVGL